MRKTTCVICLLSLGVVMGGCSEQKKSHHDHPSIDCPLHNKKADHHHKPFKNMDDYIAHLDREDRNPWQKPDAVVAALALSGSETLSDIGAGSGYFSFRFARALPQGHVFAIDIEPKMVEHMKRRAVAEGIGNISVLHSPPDDPSVPDSSDWVFICNVLHHVSAPEAWLSRLHDQLRPGAQVAIIEFKTGELPVGPPESMKIAPETVVEMLAGADFSLTKQMDDLLPYQHLFVFSRK